jgi:hypothetical protein
VQPEGGYYAVDDQQDGSVLRAYAEGQQLPAQPAEAPGPASSRLGPTKGRVGYAERTSVVASPGGHSIII